MLFQTSNSVEPVESQEVAVIEKDTGIQVVAPAAVDCDSGRIVAFTTYFATVDPAGRMVNVNPTYDVIAYSRCGHRLKLDLSCN